MDFIDYYAVLEISLNSTSDEIKKAFKKQALKWHPDKNPGHDTTERMQLINEAYLILNDIEGKQRYDNEFRKYQKYKTEQSNQKFTDEQDQSYQNHNSHQKSERFEMEDEVLKKWMKNAKNQAIELTIKTIRDLKGMSKAGSKAAIEEVKTGLQIWLFFILFFGTISILVLVFRPS